MAEVRWSNVALWLADSVEVAELTLSHFLEWFSHMQNLGNLCISHFILVTFHEVNRILVAHINHVWLLSTATLRLKLHKKMELVRSIFDQVAKKKIAQVLTRSNLLAIASTLP